MGSIFRAVYIVQVCLKGPGILPSAKVLRLYFALIKANRIQQVAYKLQTSVQSSKLFSSQSPS